MSCYFQVNSQRQKNSQGTAAMCCFLMFDRTLVISYTRLKLKIIQVVPRPLSLQIRPINKPLKKEMQHLPTVTIRSRPSTMKTLHCKHKETFIRPSYKDVKIKSVTLLSIACFSCKLSR